MKEFHLKLKTNNIRKVKKLKSNNRLYEKLHKDCREVLNTKDNKSRNAHGGTSHDSSTAMSNSSCKVNLIQKSSKDTSKRNSNIENNAVSSKQTNKSNKTGNLVRDIDDHSNSMSSSNMKATRDLDDLDYIFDSLKKKKKELTSIQTASKSNVNKNTSGKKKKTATRSNYIVSPEAPLERYDKESGLPVYKAHLLKVGEGGGTPLCPFDCDCCF